MEIKINKKGAAGTFTKLFMGIIMSLAIAIMTTNLIIESSDTQFQNFTSPSRLSELQGQFRGPIQNLSNLGIENAESAEGDQAFSESTTDTRLLVPKIVVSGIVKFIGGIPKAISELISIVFETFPEAAGPNKEIILLIVAGIGILMTLAVIKILGRSSEV